jgi:hypothetical protein
MRRGTLSRNRQRVVARVYHLLAKEAAYASNVEHLDDFGQRGASSARLEVDRCSCSSQAAPGLRGRC